MELFVAMFLTSLLMVLVVSANLFVREILNDWEDNNVICEDGRFILEQLSNDISWAADIIIDNNGVMAIGGQELDSIFYETADGGIFRCGRRLNSMRVRCDSVRLAIDEFERTIADSILVNGKHYTSERLAVIRLWLTYKGKKEYFETGVRLINENIIY